MKTKINRTRVLPPNFPSMHFFQGVAPALRYTHSFSLPQPRTLLMTRTTRPRVSSMRSVLLCLGLIFSQARAHKTINSLTASLVLVALLSLVLPSHATKLVVNGTPEIFSADLVFVSGSQPVFVLSNTTGLVLESTSSASLTSVSITLADVSGTPIDTAVEGLSISSPSMASLINGLNPAALLLTNLQSVPLSSILQVLSNVSYYNMGEPAITGAKIVIFTFTDTDSVSFASDIAVSVVQTPPHVFTCKQRAVDVVFAIDVSSYNTSIPTSSVLSYAANIIQDLPIGTQTIRFDAHFH